MFIKILLKKWLNNSQSSRDLDQMSHYMVSDLGLHFLPISLGGFQYKMGYGGDNH